MAGTAWLGNRIVWLRCAATKCKDEQSKHQSAIKCEVVEKDLQDRHTPYGLGRLLKFLPSSSIITSIKASPTTLLLLL
jgi:hypothetical protein